MPEPGGHVLNHEQTGAPRPAIKKATPKIIKISGRAAEVSALEHKQQDLKGQNDKEFLNHSSGGSKTSTVVWVVKVRRASMTIGGSSTIGQRAKTFPCVSIFRTDLSPF